MSRRRSALCALVLIAGLLSGCSGGGSPGRPAASSYLASWSRGDVAAAAAVTDDPAAAQAALKGLSSDLSVSSVRAGLTSVRGSGSHETADYAADVQLSGLGTWTYRGQLQLAKVAGSWKVHWIPADIYPTLRAGDKLVRHRQLLPRAAILDDKGQPLFAPTPIVNVGIEPARLKNNAATIASLAKATSVDAAGVATAVQHAAPHAFVSVITLRRSDYDRIRSQIHDLPGVVFQESVRYLAPTRAFARALLGTVGPATADALKHAGPLFVASDDVGLSGLQALYQQRLAGTPSGDVQIVDKAGTVQTTLHQFVGHPGQSVRVTLDRSMQIIADNVLSHVTQSAALIAVRPSTGAILAVANQPVSAFDTALTGELPPGSSFKVITTYGLLTAGKVTANTSVPCPAQVVVHGKPFKNYEHEAPGAVPFRTDFALSCNTAFVGLANQLNSTQLTDAAHALGIGGGWKLPVSVFTGSVPETDDPVEHAADMIGQGHVLVSPLAMALAAAAVESGTWRPPVVVTDPTQPAGPVPQALSSSAADTLRQLMRAVVTSGTGTAANLPGVAGKTGTAEFGNDNPPKTHAWFIAFRGDLAIAVVVEGGGVGGQVAAPLAAQFFRAVPAG